MPDHNMLEKIAAPRARQASNTMACQYFFCPAPTRSRRREGADFWAGRSSTNRWLMAKSSDEPVRLMGNRAISDASASAARALGRGVSRAASSHGSMPSRVKAETTLSVTPFCSSPTGAKRKSFRSEWSRENRADSAMMKPVSGHQKTPPHRRSLPLVGNRGPVPIRKWVPAFAGKPTEGGAA